MSLEERIELCTGGLLVKELDSDRIVNVCPYSGEIEEPILCEYLSDKRVIVEKGGKLKLYCTKYR